MSDVQYTNYSYNLSVKLYKSNLIFEKKIENYWVLFQPDWPGLPVVVADWIHKILNYFQNGTNVYDVLAELQKDTKFEFDSIISTIGFLEERGFLRSKPTDLPYDIPNHVNNQKPSYVEIWLHINSNCNLSCSYCFVAEKEQKEMSIDMLEDIASAIANTAKLNDTKEVTLKFAGGEPTLVIPLMEFFHDILLENLKNSNIKLNTAVLSNGTVLNKRLISFLKRPNMSIGISLDGYGYSHDIFRVFKESKKGSWEIIMKNIEELERNSIRPYIMGTISTQTCNSLPDFVKWIYENDYRTRLGIVRDNMTDPVCDIFQEAFEKAFVELEDPSFHIDLRNNLKITELHFDHPANGVPCGIGINHIVIKQDGNLVSCPMVTHETGEKPTNDLLSSSRNCFQFSPSQREYSSIEEDCLSCKWFPVCGGGCPLLNTKANGYPFTKSPFCDFYKYIIPRYIEFFGKKLLQAAKNKISQDNAVNHENILTV